MTINEIYTAIDQIKTAAARTRRTLKQLIDIRDTLDQIAPASPHESINEAIEACLIDLDVYARTLRGYKIRLQSLTPLEALNFK